MTESNQDAIRKWAVRSTKASFKLEGRSVPDDFVRSPEAQKFLENRSNQKMKMTPEEKEKLRRVTEENGGPHVECWFCGQWEPQHSCCYTESTNSSVCLECCVDQLWYSWILKG